MLLSCGGSCSKTNSHQRTTKSRNKNGALTEHPVCLYGLPSMAATLAGRRYATLKMAPSFFTHLLNAEAVDQLLESTGLLLQITAGAQGGIEVFHAFLVKGVDFGDVDVERFDYRGLFLGGGGHRLVHTVNLADAFGHAAQARAGLVGNLNALFAVALAFGHGCDRLA